MDLSLLVSHASLYTFKSYTKHVHNYFHFNNWHRENSDMQKKKFKEIHFGFYTTKFLWHIAIPVSGTKRTEGKIEVNKQHRIFHFVSKCHLNFI